MSSIAASFAKYAKLSPSTTPISPLVVGVRRCSQSWYSTETFSGEDVDLKNSEVKEEVDGLNDSNKRESQPHTVDPSKGWAFRGVHKAIICGKVGQAPVQKILRNGRTVTNFTVGTGGMFDQRGAGSGNSARPVQWHRIAVHNEQLGAYSVHQLVKSSSVYVEGTIETRVYNDSITGQVKSIPEICVRIDGKIRLIKDGEKVSNVSFDDLREGAM